MELSVGQLIIILVPYVDQEIYTSIKVISENRMALTVKSANILQQGKDILCIAIAGTDIYEFYSQIEDSYEDIVYIMKPVKSELSYIEKRRFNRMDCNIGFVGRPVMINDILMTKSDKQFSGAIRNISAGGVLIQTGLNLPEYMVFKFKLKLNYFMDCTAIVKRTTMAEQGYGLYEAGCEFMDMALDDIKTISMFVFKEQLRQRRKELNNSVLNR